MKLAAYFCTRSKHESEALVYQSLVEIQKSVTNSDTSFHIYHDVNNTAGLSKNYNKIIDKLSKEYDHILFVHDDVFVDDFNICNKLIKAHKLYDIVGLAGGINPTIKNPALWHLMCGGFHGGNLRGAVAHYANNDQLFMTNFGMTPDRVAVLDGLFLSVCTKAVLKTGWRFNENYTFHHYDIASCLDANKKKLRLGVYPIWVIHRSPGLLNPSDKLFVDSQTKFLEEYSNY